tara:strand:+ start:10879 stop:11718 length:840 start_codon:yes stop_codon:yes gene_type:complete
MRTIIARNTHQALAESCFQLNSFGADEPDGGKVLPIPSTTLITNSSERVASYGGLDPFQALLDGAQRLSEVRNLKVAGGELKARPDARITLYGDARENIAAVFAHVDLDGKVQLMACSNESNVLEQSDDLVFLSMLQGYLAHACGRELGVLWHTSMSPTADANQLEILSSLAAHAPQPPNQFDDPYSSGSISDTIPLLSIPAGRWHRELVQFFEVFDSVEYVDPFIQHVLAPTHRAKRLYDDAAPLATVQRAVGEIAAQDWMQACLAWVNATTKYETSE